MNGTRKVERGGGVTLKYKQTTKGKPMYKFTKGKSFIIYSGPSLIDGDPIVCIAQIGSSNRKTGDMVQTYILRSDVDPLTASKTGKDRAICGDCVHRGQENDSPLAKQAKNRTCYVLLYQGVLNKWKGLKSGIYPSLSSKEDISRIGEGRMVRIGTYGDGSAVPQEVFEALLSCAKGWTAYTHASKNPDPKVYMTSSEDLEHAQAAWKKGERTFRIISTPEALVKSKEVLCPASKEAGERTTCENCKLCSGASINAKSIAIVAHGASRNKLKQKLELVD